MRTAIGRQLHNSRRNLVIASVVGIFAVAADLVLVRWWNYYPLSIDARWAIALMAIGVYLHLVNGDAASIGLMAIPAQGWSYWARMTLLIGLAVASCIVVALGGWALAGRKLPVYAAPPSAIATSFLRMCVFSPLLEEATYRLVLCVPLAVLLRPWGAIVTSGLVFGGLHVVYGIPSPENLVGGFFLAWAFLKSETIYVPLLLHGLGNLCVLAFQVGVWYWLGTPS